MSKNHQYGLRIPKTIFGEMQAAAAADRRSVADYLLLLVEADLAERRRLRARERTAAKRG